MMTTKPKWLVIDRDLDGKRAINAQPSEKVLELRAAGMGELGFALDPLQLGSQGSGRLTAVAQQRNDRLGKGANVVLGDRLLLRTDPMQDPVQGPKPLLV